MKSLESFSTLCNAMELFLLKSLAKKIWYALNNAPVRYEPILLEGHEYEIIDYRGKTTGEVHVAVEGVEREKNKKDKKEEEEKQEEEERKKGKEEEEKEESKKEEEEEDNGTTVKP